MPYYSSFPKKSFDTKIDGIVKNLKAAKKSDVSTNLREYAIAASIFLSHAETENYLMDVVDSLAQTLATTLPNSSKLPLNLKSHLLVAGLNLPYVSQLMSQKDELKTLSSINKWFSTPSVCFFDESKALMSLTGKQIYINKKYPSLSNIEVVMARLGINKMSDQLNKVAKKDIVSLYESFGDLRTDLAHNASLPNSSCDDIIKNLSDLKQFVACIDKILFSNYSKIIGVSNWKTKLC